MPDQQFISAAMAEQERLTVREAVRNDCRLAIRFGDVVFNETILTIAISQ